MVGGLNTSEKYEFISWDDYSQYMDKKHVPNHQPEIVYGNHHPTHPHQICHIFTQDQILCAEGREIHVFNRVITPESL